MSPTPAPQDSAFQVFMSALLNAPSQGVEQEPDDMDDQLLFIWINAKVHADYQARGVFPDITARQLHGSAAGLNMNIPASLAQAMLLDACAQVDRERASGNTRPTKWSWLRNRICKEMTLSGLR